MARSRSNARSSTTIALAAAHMGSESGASKSPPAPGALDFAKGLSLDSAGQCFASRAIPICFRSESLFGSQFNYESNLRSCGLTALGSPPWFNGPDALTFHGADLFAPDTYDSKHSERVIPDKFRERLLLLPTMESSSPVSWDTATAQPGH